MPTRAWCTDCGGYVVLSAEGVCPHGHPRPSLRNLEQVPEGYVPPPPTVRTVAHAIPAEPALALAGGASTRPAEQPFASRTASVQPDIDPMLQIQLDRQQTRIYHDVPWYETWPGIVIIMIFFWPVGLFLLWRSAVPTRQMKWIFTAGVAALIAYNLIRFLLAVSVAMSSVPVPAP